MDIAVITSIANFGFAAVAAYALWTLVNKLIPEINVLNSRLVDIVQRNTEAYSEMASALRQSIVSQADTTQRIGRIDDRMLIIDQRLSHPVRECPLMETTPADIERVKAAAAKAFQEGRGG